MESDKHNCGVFHAMDCYLWKYPFLSKTVLLEVEVGMGDVQSRCFLCLVDDVELALSCSRLREGRDPCPTEFSRQPIYPVAAKFCC